MSEILGTDLAGHCDFSLDKPISCYDAPLAANTVITITTPANFNRAFFWYAVGTNVWVTLDGTTPQVPASAGVSTQEGCPAIRKINNNGTTVIKAISDTASFINVRFDRGTP